MALSRLLWAAPPRWQKNARVRKQWELDGLVARDMELDMLFGRLYEDNVSGKDAFEVPDCRKIPEPDIFWKRKRA